MAGSQLKRLKASLREQGITGPQQSKKQKRKQAEDLKARNDKRLQRSTVLENIREQFNPFQFKTNARGPKFDVTTNKPASERAKLGIKGRPGLSKAVGEERRRQTLLVEMERRNKVGGILDRRFGEDDPNMTPEEKMMERFALEKLRTHKKKSMFDLEDDEPSESLTHGGQKLFDGGELVDDFDEGDLPSDEDSELDPAEARKKWLKRMREEAVDGEEEEQQNDEPERKKTKKEVMEEVIAKSKFHKYERQAAKEEDDDLRAELDKELSDVRFLLSTRSRPQADAGKDTEEKSLRPGLEKSALEKDYDVRLRQMIQDQRAKPTTKTKTEEEIAEEAAKRLKELEENRLKRMRGEEVSGDEDEEDETEKRGKKGRSKAPEQAVDGDEDDEFGLGAGITVKMRPTATELGFDDEDDFLIDDDLVASGSDLEYDEEEEVGSDDGISVGTDDGPAVEESDDFSKFLAELEKNNPIPKDPVTNKPKEMDNDGIPYTFECPESFSDFERLMRPIPGSKAPLVVQRIRALYHPQLDSRNKEKLANFSKALVAYIGSMSRSSKTDFSVLDALIRHIHSLAKMFPIEVAKAFREIVQDKLDQGFSTWSFNFGELVQLTAIGTIFPTSDHFHQVVTPAMLVIARALGQSVPDSLDHYAKGTYLAILALQFQLLSKRYVPELINFCLDTLCALAPEQMRSRPGFFPILEPPKGARIRNCQDKEPRKLNHQDVHSWSQGLEKPDSDVQKVSILNTIAPILKAAAETWSGKAAFYETFQPAIRIMEHLLSPSCRPHLPATLITNLTQTLAYLTRSLQVAQLSRRPLELHHHKPLAIKTAIPKFEESFDPDKHYDPDRERAELAKLKAEHKRERKGAMRELRKDAGFLARENLQRKKVADQAYEKKYKRLVAEIQGEEGRASNEYEREKEARKRANKRR